MWGKKPSRERRRSGRKPTRWVGHYAIGTEPITATAPCTIEEISRHGARLVLYGGLDLRVGQSVAIDVERIGTTPVGFRVPGVVRHVSARDERGGLRIGVQLALDAPHEKRIAETLFA
jgi:hypothetical protein